MLNGCQKTNVRTDCWRENMKSCDQRCLKMDDMKDSRENSPNVPYCLTHGSTLFVTKRFFVGWYFRREKQERAGGEEYLKSPFFVTGITFFTKIVDRKVSSEKNLWLATGWRILIVENGRICLFVEDGQLHNKNPSRIDLLLAYALSTILESWNRL